MTERTAALAALLLLTTLPAAAEQVGARARGGFPDDTERNALEHYVKAGHGESRPLTSFAKWGKQDVYRHMESIRLIPPAWAATANPKASPTCSASRRTGWKPATSSA